jgi:ATP/maltotriose-dependent transcriptional regulator MalT
MSSGDAPDRARESFDRRAWGAAYEQLSAADHEGPLSVLELERLAVCAFLLGHPEECTEVWTRVHRERLRSGDTLGAAQSTFWLSFMHGMRGEMAPAIGWVGRGRRLLEENGLRESPQWGYLLMPEGIALMEGGDVATALPLFEQAIALADADQNLLVLARMALGQSLMVLGETARGAALLDEIMVAITADEISPIVAGLAYCAVIDACATAFDLRRAREWTAELSRWSEGQPDLVPFRGQCLVHRAELMRLRGAWPDALHEAERARERLSDPPGQFAVGAAFYELGELYRLRGDVAAAENAYREAGRAGRSPQPGLALLRLAQGQVDAAEAAIRLAVDGAIDPAARARCLAAFVEIALAFGDVEAARSAATELAQLAADRGAPFLRAVAGDATGAVRLMEGDAAGALGDLRGAREVWRELDAPYEAARTRVLLAAAARDLGDQDTAETELDAARASFQQLGAAPDLARLEGLMAKEVAGLQGGLTGREVQVLSLVATGMTNRAIATQLVISEKTVARHVSNIFAKLGVSSRSAATAFAYEHGLV